jgi:aminoglycoside phosphotransferase family enzyme/predicted kinase
MELDRLIAALADPAAYPGQFDAVEVRHTHISAVFLAGEHAYKIKKPVELGFVDFSTLERRRHFCHEELRLNRRLAADVYLDVVPIVADGRRVKVEADGPAIEWAVKMRRLPDEATLEHRLDRGEVGPELIEDLAVRIARFHALAERGEHVSRFGRFEVVERNALENFEQAAPQVGSTISRAVFDRLQSLTAEALARHRALIESRAGRGVPCDTHGDLRLGHVYHFPERAPPADLVVIDCVEFNERFRFADPVSDMAFLQMSLARSGYCAWAAAFEESYFRAAGDDEGRALVPLYVSYRAAVRGKVDGMQAAHSEIPPDDRQVALSKSRGYWLLALGALEQPANGPCLVLVGGLPGTGKSTLAAALAQRAGCKVIRSDVVRKELAGTLRDVAESAAFEQGIYSPEWTGRTYAECLRRAESLLFEGGRVVVDANFRDDTQRRTFLDAAAHWGVPPILLVCQADAETVRTRLLSRNDDVSDADWSIYEQAAHGWQRFSPATQRAVADIDTSGTVDSAVQQALVVLMSRALFS